VKNKKPNDRQYQWVSGITIAEKVTKELPAIRPLKLSRQAQINNDRAAEINSGKSLYKDAQKNGSK
jgi:hypothetical protein